MTPESPLVSAKELADEIEGYLAPDFIYHDWKPSYETMHALVAALRQRAPEIPEVYSTEAQKPLYSEELTAAMQTLKQQAARIAELEQDAGDGVRLAYLHRELKVTIAYALKWGWTPQDMTSFRAKLDAAAKGEKP